MIVIIIHVCGLGSAKQFPMRQDLEEGITFLRWPLDHNLFGVYLSA